DSGFSGLNSEPGKEADGSVSKDSNNADQVGSGFSHAYHPLKSQGCLTIPDRQAWQNAKT
ncbi:MAG: hypothetical protein VX228_11580, partial [Pseudomonadota bacterium]|nr:hypothetical protein [Pseudomonadota bacterium]